MQKDFESWHEVKAELQLRKNIPTFRNREIWWCSLGVNIGDEEDGKGKKFNRPVLILRKFNNKIFWGVPLTTKIKENPHYYKIDIPTKIGDKEQLVTQCIMLSHLRLWDSKRLTHKMSQLSMKQFNDIRESLKYLI